MVVGETIIKKLFLFLLFVFGCCCGWLFCCLGLPVRAPNCHDDRLALLAQVLAEVVRVVDADAVTALCTQTRVVYACHVLCVHLFTRRALGHHGRLLGKVRHVHLGVAFCSQVCPASVWGGC